MWKYLIMIIAVVGAAFGIHRSRVTTVAQPTPPPFAEPIRNPFPQGISGAGIVEPASESISIGVSDAGLVMKVFVKKSQKVKAGEPLFQIDSRLLEAELITARAAIATADSELQRVKAFRRKEDEPGLRAKVAQAEAAQAEAVKGIEQAEGLLAERKSVLEDARDKLKRLEMTSRDATPEELSARARFLVETEQARFRTAQRFIEMMKAREKSAQAAIESARADLNVYLAGPWAPDVAKAEAAVAEARAKVLRIESDIQRRTVRAPLDATVLRLNLREGEYATATSARAEDAPMVLGQIDPLHIRVDVDEFDAQKITPGLKAVAFYKSGGETKIPLQFVRIEPFIVPKRALTNSQRELVDTRVLQVVFRIANADANVYVGQQLDVFIDPAK